MTRFIDILKTLNTYMDKLYPFNQNDYNILSSEGENTYEDTENNENNQEKTNYNEKQPCICWACCSYNNFLKFMDFFLNYFINNNSKDYEKYE